ncbi:DUF3107 domain-containing protein [Pseudonocardia sp. H11422]|uniref:DUF3107 domain-containing protein n=1 Tax=Pseudonocardia sp. H11422 TaxID=2835866 RepID=UPI001BDD9F93|nr:DUF3107 domain-containing protein [Pseudonocardia sp. H11422]
MEIRIGVARSPREIVVSSGETPDAVLQRVAASLASENGLLTLVDDEGCRYIVPASLIAFVEITLGEQQSGFTAGGRS